MERTLIEASDSAKQRFAIAPDSAIKEQSTCLCCASAALSAFLKLGDQCPCNAFHLPGDMIPTFPLEAVLCEQCLHGQLRYAVDPEVLFANYAYRTRISQTLVAHFEQLARDVRASRIVRRVLDVGCNDGTLLTGFKKLGCETWGIDPVDVLDRRGVDHFIQGYCDIPTILSGQFPRFDVVTATNVLAHAADPVSLLSACKETLADGGAIVIEVPYALRMLERNEFDTVYFEHVSYFTVTSLAGLASRVGLSIAEVRETSVHGGSLRLVLQRLSDHPSHCRRAHQMLSYERTRMTDLAATTQERVDAICRALNHLVESQRAKGRRIVGFGASGKSSVVLSAAKIDLEFIIDQTPEKIGKLTPGRDIPIIDLCDMPDDDRPTDHVILAWNCAAECLAKIKSARPHGRRDGIISYVPAAKWEPLFANDQ